MLIAYALLITFGWTLASLLEKDLLQRYHHHVLLCITLTIFWIATLIITPVFDISSWKVASKDIGKCITLALGGFLMSYTALFYAIQNWDMVQVITLAYLTPLLILLYEILIAGRKFKWLDLMGVSLCVAGAVMISIP